MRHFMESQIGYIAGGPNRDSSSNRQDPASNSMARKNFDDFTVKTIGIAGLKSRANEVPLACRIQVVQEALVRYLSIPNFGNEHSSEVATRDLFEAMNTRDALTPGERGAQIMYLNAHDEQLQCIKRKIKAKPCLKIFFSNKNKIMFTNNGKICKPKKNTILNSCIYLNLFRSYSHFFYQIKPNVCIPTNQWKNVPPFKEKEAEKHLSTALNLLTKVKLVNLKNQTYLKTPIGAYTVSDYNTIVPLLMFDLARVSRLKTFQKQIKLLNRPNIRAIICNEIKNPVLHLNFENPKIKIQDLEEFVNSDTHPNMFINHNKGFVYNTSSGSSTYLSESGDRKSKDIKDLPQKTEIISSSTNLRADDKTSNVKENELKANDIQRFENDAATVTKTETPNKPLDGCELREKEAKPSPKTPSDPKFPIPNPVKFFNKSIKDFKTADSAVKQKSTAKKNSLVKNIIQVNTEEATNQKSSSRTEKVVLMNSAKSAPFLNSDESIQTGSKHTMASSEYHASTIEHKSKLAFDSLPCSEPELYQNIVNLLFSFSQGDYSQFQTKDFKQFVMLNDILRSKESFYCILLESELGSLDDITSLYNFLLEPKNLKKSFCYSKSMINRRIMSESDVFIKNLVKQFSAMWSQTNSSYRTNTMTRTVRSTKVSWPSEFYLSKNSVIPRNSDKSTDYVGKNYATSKCVNLKQNSTQQIHNIQNISVKEGEGLSGSFDSPEICKSTSQFDGDLDSCSTNSLALTSLSILTNNSCLKPSSSTIKLETVVSPIQSGFQTIQKASSVPLTEQLEISPTVPSTHGDTDPVSNIVCMNELATKSHTCGKTTDKPDAHHIAILLKVLCNIQNFASSLIIHAISSNSFNTHKLMASEITQFSLSSDKRDNNRIENDDLCFKISLPSISVLNSMVENIWLVDLCTFFDHIEPKPPDYSQFLLLLTDDTSQENIMSHYNHESNITRDGTSRDPYQSSRSDISNLSTTSFSSGSSGIFSIQTDASWDTGTSSVSESPFPDEIEIRENEYPRVFSFLRNTNSSTNRSDHDKTVSLSEEGFEHTLLFSKNYVNPDSNLFYGRFYQKSPRKQLSMTYKNFEKVRNNHNQTKEYVPAIVFRTKVHLYYHPPFRDLKYLAIFDNKQDTQVIDRVKKE